MSTSPTPSHAPRSTAADTTSGAPREKLFNLPPLTLGLLGLLLALHAVLAFFPAIGMQMLAWTAFLPRFFTDYPAETGYRLLTYGFLHGGWLHLMVNMAGLAAFGSGIERLTGKRWLLAIFTLGIICGGLGHWAIDRFSGIPLVGASAGISALFGSLLPFVVARRSLTSVSLIFIATNMAVGLIGFADEPGMMIAWHAHIAGFLFGLGVGLLKKRYLYAPLIGTTDSEEHA